MRYFSNDASELVFAAPSTKIAVLGGVALALGASFLAASWAIGEAGAGVFGGSPDAAALSVALWCAGVVAVAVAAVLALSAVAYRCLVMTDADRIAVMARKGLCLRKYGNPLGLKDGELLPRVSCSKVSDCVYRLRVGTGSVTDDAISNASASISASLVGRYGGYAVTQTEVGIAHDAVTFTIEDVTEPHGLTFDYVAQLTPPSVTELVVQRGTSIDLRTSGSILVAGKTRSGKTTGIISLLLQILLMGPDGHGSEVVVVDPKRAELSRLPHVVAPDGDGDAHSILDAMRAFATSMTERQAYLNNLSAETGDAVKWWDAGMHPSFLFIDEYVAARTLLPQRAPKDDPGYSLKEFDDLLKRIVTMGASAGCFVIVSIAEASVDSGGLPAMLRSAMGTKVLFRPTMPEARLMWDAERLRDMPERAYGPGEAWFSSTDGVHDGVAYVRFPVMRFRLYDELGHLLMAYGE